MKTTISDRLTPEQFDAWLATLRNPPTGVKHLASKLNVYDTRGHLTGACTLGLLPVALGVEPILRPTEEAWMRGGCVFSSSIWGHVSDPFNLEATLEIFEKNDGDPQCTERVNVLPTFHEMADWLEENRSKIVQEE